MRSLRVEIPMLPPKECSPNARVHWAKRHKATQEFRLAAKILAYYACEHMPPGYLKAKVSITLVIPDRRYIRDPDNMIASLKPAFDGLQDAGVILGDDDEHLLIRLPIKYEIDKQKAPAIILELSPQRQDKDREVKVRTGKGR